MESSSSTLKQVMVKQFLPVKAIPIRPIQNGIESVRKLRTIIDLIRRLHPMEKIFNLKATNGQIIGNQ